MISCPQCGAIEVKAEKKTTVVLDERGKRIVAQTVYWFCKCTICRHKWSQEA